LLESGVARCENSAEKNSKTDSKMEANLQAREVGGDEEMVIFFGGADPRVIGDRKCLKLTKKFTSELPDECAPIRG
jgi:hypothetical protein